MWFSGGKDLFCIWILILLYIFVIFTISYILWTWYTNRSSNILMGFFSFPSRHAESWGSHDIPTGLIRLSRQAGERFWKIVKEKKYIGTNILFFFLSVKEICIVCKYFWKFFNFFCFKLFFKIILNCFNVLILKIFF